MGFIGPFGDVLLPLVYEHVGAFRDSLALVVKGNKAGYVRMDGQVAIAIDYDAAADVASWADLTGGLAKVVLNNKRCLIDRRNVRVLPCQYADIGAATGRLIPVRKKTKWGFADRKGDLVVPEKYDQAWPMVNGLARVKVGELFGAIDSTGKEVIAPRFTALTQTEHGLFVATSATGTGLVDAKGAEKVALVYDKVALITDRIARVERNERFAYVRLADGRFLWKEEGFEQP